MSSIYSFTGLASGIQWRDLVDEMMRAEQIRRVNPLTQQAAQDQRRIDAWGTFRTLSTRLETASKKLAGGGAFGALTTSGGTSPTSGRSLVSAAATDGASPGTYQIEVLGLARTEKAGMAAGVADATQPLGFAGTFHVNEVEVEIRDTDSLHDLRDRINQASRDGRAGVTATIITPQEGESRLMLTADGTGWNGVELRDGEGGVLQRLGILDDAAERTDNRTIDGKLSTQRLTADGSEVPARSVASLLGLSTPPLQQRVIVGGQEIRVDLETDTLQDLLNKVLDAGGSGRIATETVGGREMYRLEVDGEVAATDDPESQRVLDLLGFTRAARTQEVAGADSHIRLDSIDVVRRGNSTSTVIPGVTLNLQTAEPGTKVDVDIRRNTQGAIDAVREFASAYNALLSFSNGQRAAGQPLASNGTLRTAMSSFTDVMLTPTTGLSTAFDRAALVGVSLSRTGELQVDEARLRSALEADPAAVRALFEGETRADGTVVAGLGGRMQTAAARVTRTGDGLVANQIDSLNRSIESVTRRRSDAEARLELRRESLLNQFMRMESAMNTIQGQGNWLTAQLQAMRPRER